jgi:hypothetical protein
MTMFMHCMPAESVESERVIFLTTKEFKRFFGHEARREGAVAVV